MLQVTILAGRFFLTLHTDPISQVTGVGGGATVIGVGDAVNVFGPVTHRTQRELVGTVEEEGRFPHAVRDIYVAGGALCQTGRVTIQRIVIRGTLPESAAVCLMFMIERFLSDRVDQVRTIRNQTAVILQAVLCIGVGGASRQVLVHAQRVVCPLRGCHGDHHEQGGEQGAHGEHRGICANSCTGS
jgi:hypothetical protein